MTAKLGFGFTAEDIIAEKRITREEIDETKAKLKDEQLPELTDEQIVLFVLSCDRDLDFTIVTIKEYYKARKNAPELFDDRDLERTDLDYQLNIIQYSIFPKRMPDGCAVLFHRLQDFRFSRYCIEPSMKLLFMTLDSAVYDHPPTGLIILFDMQGVSLMHLTRTRLGAVRKFCHYLQEGLPVKLREIHVLNTTFFVDKVMAIVKPFIKLELLDKLIFHSPDEDMEKFYAEVIPKECLPRDFGGNLPDMMELHERNTKKLIDMKEYFDEEQRQREAYYEKH